MNDIFLSYSTKDRDRLKPLFQALAQQGWSVFWDHQSIHTGENWHRKIEEAINNSRCVVVVWSKHSIHSEWVLEEASRGKARDVLLPIRIDAIEPPFGFGMRQAGDFTGWNGKGDHPAFIELAAQIYGLLGRGSQPLPPPPKSRQGVVLAGVTAVAVAGGGIYLQQNGYFTGENGAAIEQSVASVAELKVVPAPVATFDGEKVYKGLCFSCHDTGVAGSPKLGDKAAWSPRIATGNDALYASSLNGKGAMPAKGGNSALSDEEVKAAVDWMVSQAK
ncbi:TIR domain-containing protein [Thiothrix subterranea]|uniref:TIR domain-containing protein n=1 Tax=Thiothrix subterranea TaxID=2735563 RepID=A0AA51R198_9GAMM|nr:TIR domain-containing protein [Thiothrix subterranea]MDQ5767317.1 TIR domain-containing protein [Thiothrix subterranea]WML88822.1 TIR domain-containing protein [Thiothrix subterranea]